MMWYMLLVAAVLVISGLCLCLFCCPEGHVRDEFDREVRPRRLHQQAAGRGLVEEAGFQRGARVDFHRYRVSQLGFK